VAAKRLAVLFGLEKREYDLYLLLVEQTG